MLVFASLPASFLAELARNTLNPGINTDSAESTDRLKSISQIFKSIMQARQAKISLVKFGDIQKQNSNCPSLSLLL